MNTFKHSGDLGDIIYSLPTIKALGGGTVYLNPGKPLPKPINGIPTKKFTSVTPINMIRPLLEAQDYIDKVLVWDGEEVTYDLDQFRNKGYQLGRTNLAEAHCMAFGIDKSVINEQWIFNVQPKKVKNAKYVFHRSARYHNHEFEQKWWPYYIGRYAPHAVFVGIPDEYKDFIKRFNCHDLEFYQVRDFLELAEIISGSELFVGNQSMPFSISEGLHVKNVLEMDRNNPNCIFIRPGNTTIL